MQHTTLSGTRELMRHPGIDLILATGGTGLVRAAYGSGKPAYGVGPGNVPAFIESTADIRKAVADIFAGKTFDYGTICSSEQAIVVGNAQRDATFEECRAQGGHFLTPEEATKVGALVFLPGTRAANTAIVGRPATVIAALAGINVPATTRVLIAQLEPGQIGREFPLSAEKLSPILAFYTVANLAAAIDTCTKLLEFGGLGHTCAIHSQNESAIRQFGQAVPAFRVCVNTSAVHGSIGYSTNLFPAMTLGCGALGGNITSDNIGPHHLMNIKRIAWESRRVEHRTVPADQRLAGTMAMPQQERSSDQGTAGTDLKRASVVDAAAPSSGEAVALQSAAAADTPLSAGSAFDRTIIAATVRRVLDERGFVRGGARETAGSASPALTESPAPSPTVPSAVNDVASQIVDRVFKAASNSAGPESRPPQHKSPTETPIVASAQNVSPSDPGNPIIEISPFVSENDVRRAITRNEKIFIGPKTIVTPSARDMAREHDVFIETQGTPHH